jgi:hypothetical protein
LEYLLFSAVSSSTTNNLLPLELTAATMLARHSSRIENNECILDVQLKVHQMLDGDTFTMPRNKRQGPVAAFMPDSQGIHTW